MILIFDEIRISVPATTGLKEWAVRDALKTPASRGQTKYKFPDVLPKDIMCMTLEHSAPEGI